MGPPTYALVHSTRALKQFSVQCTHRTIFSWAHVYLSTERLIFLKHKLGRIWAPCGLHGAQKQLHAWGQQLFPPVYGPPAEPFASAVSTSLMKIPPAGQKEEKKRKEKGDDKRGGKTAISPLSAGKQGARRSSYLTYPYSWDKFASFKKFFLKWE